MTVKQINIEIEQTLMLRILWVFIVVALIGSVLLVALKNHVSAIAFQSVSKGMGKSEVLSIMGRPDAESTACMNPAMWLDEPADNQECVRELQYNALLVPEFWTVGFDAHDRTITKYHFISP